MKFTAALAAIAGFALGKNTHHVPFTHLQLAQMDRIQPSEAPIKRTLELAQTDAEATVGATPETVTGVTHPDTRGTDVTILDRAASDKTTGIVSYQLFFDAKIDAIQTKLPVVAGFEDGNGLYDTDTHICAFRFRWEKPFEATTSNARWMIAVTHDCPTDLTPPIGGFKFVISLPTAYGDATAKKFLVSSSHKDKFNPHIAVPVNDVITWDGTNTLITFEIANEDAASYSRFGVWLPNDYATAGEGGAVDEDDGAWTYTYEVLAAAPYSA